MAVRVKVPRLRLIARLESVRDEAKKQHEKELKKYATDRLKARNAAAIELRKKADAIINDPDIYVGNETRYFGSGRNERYQLLLAVPTSLKFPTKPEPHRALDSVEKTIVLLDASDDDKVSISTDDLSFYGIGNLAGLDN